MAIEDLNEKLIDAVERGKVKSAEKFIDNGASVGCGDELPIRMALEQEDGKMVKMLVEKGANINAILKGKSILYHAVYAGNLKKIKILMDNGASINDPLKKVIFDLAIKKGDKDLVTKLISMGVDTNIESKEGILYDEAMKTVLLDHGVKLNKDFDVRIYGGENTSEISNILDELLKQKRTILKDVENKEIKQVDVFCVKRSKFEPNKYKIVLRKDDGKVYKRYKGGWENNNYHFEEEKKREKPLFVEPVFKIRKVVKKIFRMAFMKTYSYERPISLKKEIKREKNVSKGKGLSI